MIAFVTSPKILLLLLHKHSIIPFDSLKRPSRMILFLCTILLIPINRSALQLQESHYLSFIKRIWWKKSFEVFFSISLRPAASLIIAWVFIFKLSKNITPPKRGAAQSAAVDLDEWTIPEDAAIR